MTRNENNVNVVGGRACGEKLSISSSVGMACTGNVRL